jgi:hypothetical protein
MTRAEYQQQNDVMRQKLAAYESLVSPEQIQVKLKAAEEAINSNALKFHYN